MGASALEQPSELEVKNARKVLDMLSEIEDISYEVIRDDVFKIKDNITGTICLIDVEETMVCLQTNVCDLPADQKLKAGVLEFLMNLNGNVLHGKFAVRGQKIVYADTLEIENLDRNELEASVGWCLGAVGSNIEQIAGMVS